MPGGRGRRRREITEPDSTAAIPPDSYAPGRGMGRRRGRRKALRRVDSLPPVSTFAPADADFAEPEDAVILTVEEYESVRLADFIGMEQEEAAFQMGVSRRAFWQDLQSARFKIAKALSTGRKIIIEGGDFSLTKDKE